MRRNIWKKQEYEKGARAVTGPVERAAGEAKAEAGGA